MSVQNKTRVIRNAHYFEQTVSHLVMIIHLRLGGYSLNLQAEVWATLSAALWL